MNDQYVRIDYFAGQALAGLLASGAMTEKEDRKTLDRVCEQAWNIAKIMEGMRSQCNWKRT